MHFTYILTSARIVVFNIVDLILLAHPCDSINLSYTSLHLKKNAKQTSKPGTYVPVFLRGMWS